MGLQDGREQVVQLLLAHNANINARNNNGNTPLWFAIESRRPSIIKLLAKQPNIDIEHRGKKSFLLSYVIHQWDTCPEEIINFLVKKSDLNEIDKEGQSLLSIIATHGNLKMPIIHILLKQPNININALCRNRIDHSDDKRPPYDEITPLDIALYCTKFGRDNQEHQRKFQEIINLLKHMVKKQGQNLKKIG